MKEFIVISNLQEFITYNFTVTVSTIVGTNAPQATPTEVQITTDESGEHCSFTMIAPVSNLFTDFLLIQLQVLPQSMLILQYSVLYRLIYHGSHPRTLIAMV